MQIRGPSSLELIRILGQDGEVLKPDLMTEVSQTFRGNDVIDIHEGIILDEFLSQQASADALMSRLGEKRATLMIAPFGETAAKTFAKIAQKKDVVDNNGVIRRRDRVCTYGRYWDVDTAMGVKPISVIDGFYENLDINSLKDFIDHGCDLPRVPVGMQLDFAVGQALRQKILEDGFFVVWAFHGDAAVAQGYFHESLNIASTLKLPVIFVCRNNQWGISTRQHEMTATKTYAEKALAYNMAFLRADGNDIFATYRAYKLAYEYVERTGEPFLIELLTYRLWYHTTAVNLNPLGVPENEIKRALLEAPLRRNRLFLWSQAAKKYLGLKWTREDELSLYLKITGKKLFDLASSIQWKEPLCLDWITESDKEYFKNLEMGPGLVQEITEASYRGAKSCMKRRKDFIAKWEKLNTDILFEPMSPEFLPKEPLPELPEIIKNATCLDSIKAGQYVALAKDRRAFIAGEDVGPGGGVMRATSLRKNLALELFPNLEHRILREFLPFREIFPKRVINTPLCENGIVGIFGTGASQGGLRPIVEIQFDEFGLIAVDQIQEAAKEIQLKGGLVNLPLVIRLPYGWGKRISWHQYCSMARFANLVGVVIATYSTVRDAFEMFIAASRCNRPVLFYEPIELYRPEFFLKHLGWYKYGSERDKEWPFADPTRPLRRDLKIHAPEQPIESFGVRVAKEGKSKEETRGRSVTIISYGAMIYHVLRAAALIERIEHGSSVEVLDLRVIKPMDTAGIVKSVGKTGRLMVAEEMPKDFGIGAEILARIFESKDLFLRNIDAAARRVAPPQVHFLSSQYVEFIVPNYKDVTRAGLEILHE